MLFRLYPCILHYPRHSDPSLSQALESPSSQVSTLRSQIARRAHAHRHEVVVQCRRLVVRLSTLSWTVTSLMPLSTNFNENTDLQSDANQ